MDWKLYVIEGIALLFLGIGTYFDMKYKMLPNLYFLFSGMGAVVCNVLLRYQSFREFFGGCLWGGILLLTGYLTKEEVGYGDGLGLLILGAFCGGKRVLLLTMSSFFLSGIWGLWKILWKKKTKKDRIAFYPFLFGTFLWSLAR